MAQIPNDLHPETFANSARVTDDLPLAQISNDLHLETFTNNVKVTDDLQVAQIQNVLHPGNVVPTTRGVDTNSLSVGPQRNWTMFLV